MFRVYSIACLTASEMPERTWPRSSCSAALIVMPEGTDIESFMDSGVMPCTSRLEAPCKHCAAINMAAERGKPIDTLALVAASTAVKAKAWHVEPSAMAASINGSDTLCTLPHREKIDITNQLLSIVAGKWRPGLCEKR